MSDHDAVVYDLDGTLVRLDVDWATVRAEVAAILAERDVATDGLDLWEMLERSVETNHRDAVHDAIAAHERTGAEASTRLPLADELPLDRPVGVVSLNSEDACRAALDLHDLTAHVDVVIGRDTTERFKPDPDPLLAAVDALGVAPERAVFVGDSASDRTTAERAGTAFQWASDRAE